MINNLPGPEKGLLETLFSSGDKPQAVLPENALKELSGKQSGAQLAQNFSELLKSSQDQKILSVADLKNQTQSSEQGAQELDSDTLAALKAALKAETNAKPAVSEAQAEPAKAGSSAVIPSALLAKKAEASNAEGVEVQALNAKQSRNSKDDKIAKKEAVLLEKTKQVNQDPKGKEEIDKKKQSVQGSEDQNLAVASMNALAHSSAPAQANGLNLANGKAAVAQNAEKPLSKANSKTDGKEKADLKNLAALKRADDASLLKTNTALSTNQEFPLSQMPIEVLSAKDAEPRATHSEWGKSSADFLAERSQGQGAILGVNRADPRLVGRTASLKEEEQGEAGFNQDIGSMNLNSDLKPISIGTMPLNGHAKAAALNNVIPLHETQVAGKMDAYNSMGLASEVNRLARQGGGTVRLKLEPENLGEMTVTVSQGQNKSLNVQFETANHDARSVILDSVTDLREALKSNNYNVENIGVEMKSSKMTSANSLVSEAMALDRLRSDWLGSGTSSLSKNESQSNSNYERSNQNWQDGSSRGQGGKQGQGWSQQRGYRSYQDMEYGT